MGGEGGGQGRSRVGPGLGRIMEESGKGRNRSRLGTVHEQGKEQEQGRRWQAQGRSTRAEKEQGTSRARAGQEQAAKLG